MAEQASQDIGAELRLARELAGLSLRQIADKTKLSVHTLSSLERNRISQLPGGIYRRAIVRAYASEVGLDPEATLRIFLADHPDDVPSAAHVPDAAAPRPSRRRLRTVVALIGGLFPVVAGYFYFSHGSRGR
jgi:cytoskeletal protein RodZ